ncbi:hypothetical protein LQ384_11030 [Rhodococcus rhodochrous]|uniref:Mce-associated membrane protein n=1 Tax=Rhodococcus rhodochrous TaxID=1829 RepID=A0AAW4XEQ9_RHORH|nr:MULTISPECIES: hypothetical protein [Rhodococcus]MCD2111631.1 hypothetical protein [Rhodococcus rhodochrous]WAL46015.1 hypothetical protein OQN32_21625 [Rhodococcus pyridinivorans]
MKTALEDITDTHDREHDTVQDSTRRRLPMRGIVVAIGVLLVAMLAVVGWQWNDARNERDALLSDAAARAEAEQVALDYALGAAEMDFRDLGAWRSRLTSGTTPELTDRLDKAATSMEQIIVPLQWTSIAEPITAKAVSGPDGTFTVDCFVSVRTTNAQAPEGIVSTATYRLGMDNRDGWTITEISGVGADALPDGPR